MVAQNASLPTLSKSLTNGMKTYGAYCGIAGKHPPTRIILEDLIVNQEIESIESWLSSPNLVIQTYAAEGLIRLANGGAELSEYAIDKVLDIKDKTDLISTCKGCFYEELTIRECLIDLQFNFLPE